jgi:hypothetical protein
MVKTVKREAKGKVKGKTENLFSTGGKRNLKKCRAVFVNDTWKVGF